MIQVNLVRRTTPPSDHGNFIAAVVLFIIGSVLLFGGLAVGSIPTHVIGCLIVFLAAAGAGEEEGPCPDGFPDG